MVLKYVLSTCPFYTPHYRMNLSKQKCCFLLTGVSTENQKRISVLQVKRAFYDSYECWLTLSYLKILLFSWKIWFCAIWRRGISTTSGSPMGTNGSFYVDMKGILCLTCTNMKNMTLEICLTKPRGDIYHR